MLQHPGKLLAEYLENNGYTQKSFSVKVGKRVSEINELIRGKRNITVAWDIILSKYLATAPKFWILKQVDYDYEQALLSGDVNLPEVQRSQSQQESQEIKKIETNPFSEKTLDDIIEEEKIQNQYLKENIFKETPLEGLKKEPPEKNILQKGKTLKKEKKVIDIKELLKEDPIDGNGGSLKQVFDSF